MLQLRMIPQKAATVAAPQTASMTTPTTQRVLRRRPRGLKTLAHCRVPRGGVGRRHINAVGGEIWGPPWF